MPFKLLSAFVPPALRLLANVAALVEKAGLHCEYEGLQPTDLLEARLARDMLPFSYQVKSVIVHSVGAFHGARRARFSPDTGPHDFEFAEIANGWPRPGTRCTRSGPIRSTSCWDGRRGSRRVAGTRTCWSNTF